MPSRTFFAIDSPSAAKPQLELLLRELGSMGARASNLEKLHITALFVGEDLDDKVIAKAAEALSKVNYKSFNCTVSGLGVFTEENPQVVFAKVSAGSKELSALNSILRIVLAKADIKTEPRYHPHLTLARVKRDTDVEKVIDLIRKSSEPEFSFVCTELKLMQSHATEKGTVYNNIASISLTA